MKFFSARFIIVAAAIATWESVMGQTTIPLVDINTVDPTIVVELLYAGVNNFSGHALYPPRTTALVRPEVAPRLAAAQAFLRRYQYQLKIWDAYRPTSVQLRLWQLTHKTNYIADPGAGPGSMHSWGIAVDATLADAENNTVNMPSDFDDFTPAAMLHYQGIDPVVFAKPARSNRNINHRAYLCRLRLAGLRVRRTSRKSGYINGRQRWTSLAGRAQGSRRRSHLFFLCAGSSERARDRPADQMAQIFCAAYDHRDFVWCSDSGHRWLHRLCRRKNSPPRVSQ